MALLGKILKYTLIAAVLLCVSGFILWMALCLTNQEHEELHKAAAEYFAPYDVPQDNNLYIALIGMHSPADSKDPYKDALNIIRYYENNVNEEDPYALPPGSLDYQDVDGITEKLCTYLEDFQEDKKCAGSEDIQILMDKNQVIMKRYMALSQGDYTQLVQYINSDIAVPKGQDLIMLEVLFSAYLIDMTINGDGDRAIDLWIHHQDFLKDLISLNDNGLVFSAIKFIIYGEHLKTLHVLIELNPALAKRYKQSLLRALDKNIYDLWDIRSAFHYDGYFFIYTIMNIAKDTPSPVLDMNGSINTLYSISQDLEAMNDLPFKDRLKQLISIEKRYECSFTHPFGCHWYNPLGNLLIGELLKLSGLFANSYRSAISQELLKSSILAYSRNIAPENMETFLQEMKEDSGIIKYDIGWDGDKKSFIFKDDYVDLKVPYLYNADTQIQ